VSEDARTAYLFQYKGKGLFAVSYDRTGSNTPRTICTQSWIFCEQFELGSRTHNPAPIILRTTATTCAAAGAALPSARQSNAVR
jgi:hypothetical protein